MTASSLRVASADAPPPDLPPYDGTGPLDLRADGELTPARAAAGWHELVPGELVRPVPLTLRGVAATRALGARLAGALRPGDLVVLDGPLGAGKTALTQGLGEALGVHGRVTSPTFVLAREHRGPLPLVHVDAYRLLQGGTLDDLDLEAALEVGVVVVEWGEGVVEHLAPSRLHVALDRPAGAPGELARLDDGTGAEGDEVRTAVVRVRGPRWATVQAF